jgi:beta-lactamase class A
LNDGTWFGIDESTMFTPGSLLKVPLALSILRRYESDPSFARKPLTYTGDDAEKLQTFPPLEYAKAGKAYTLPELLRLSLMFSDNNATGLLTTLIDFHELQESYSDLGITPPEAGKDYLMSVRTYTSFFRILYNATYINHTDSNAVLDLLSQSSFTQGLRAGVPEHVPVAHKFGERVTADLQESQLHDCGIVYQEDTPYILCVMLRGKDMKVLPPIIAEISRITYEKRTRK